MAGSIEGQVPGRPGRRKGSGARAGGDASWGLRAVQALADPSRWRMVEALAAGPRSLGELAHDIGLSAGCTSHHISILKEVGLVQTSRAGRQIQCSTPDPGTRGADFLAAVQAGTANDSLISNQVSTRPRDPRSSLAAPELEDHRPTGTVRKRSIPMEDYLL